MSKLDSIIKDLNKKLKNDIITTDIDGVTFTNKETVPFASPGLTYLFHGGLPVHTLVTIAGEFSAGKSSLCMSIAGSFQKYYKKKWQDRVDYLTALEKPNKNEKAELIKLNDDGHKKVLFIDVEASASSEWASRMGFDMNDCVYIKPQGESAEEILEIALQLIQSDCICLVVLDSVAALSSMAQMEKTLSEKTYCGVASVMTIWTAKLMSMLNKYDCTVICINQLRDNLASAFGGSKMPGGRALKFNSHIILELRKGKALDESYKEIPNNSESYYGQYTIIGVDKNKVTKPDRRRSQVSIVFNHGVYPLLDTFNLAYAYNIIEKSGAWYQYSDEEGNPKVDEEGNNMKWQGMSNALTYMQTHKEFYDEVYDKVIEAIS